MQISAKIPPDTESQQRAKEIAARYPSYNAAIRGEKLPFTKGTFGDLVHGNWHNLSLDTVNAFREAIGLDLLPEPQLKYKQPAKPRRPQAERYYPPKDPIKFADYMFERVSEEDWEIIKSRMLRLKYRIGGNK